MLNLATNIACFVDSNIRMDIEEEEEIEITLEISAMTTSLWCMTVWRLIDVTVISFQVESHSRVEQQFIRSIINYWMNLRSGTGIMKPSIDH